MKALPEPVREEAPRKVAGDVEEVQVEKKTFSEEDILLVQQQTGATKERAAAALKESDGEVARAIMKLSS